VVYSLLQLRSWPSYGLVRHGEIAIAELWGTKLSVGLGNLSLEKDLTHWINDGLNAIFPARRPRDQA